MYFARTCTKEKKATQSSVPRVTTGSSNKTLISIWGETDSEGEEDVCIMALKDDQEELSEEVHHNDQLSSLLYEWELLRMKEGEYVQDLHNRFLTITRSL